MKRIIKCYRQIEEYILILLLIISAAIVCYSVFMRYIFNSPPIWCEEIVCYFQVWIAFLGVSYIARNPDDFIRFDFVIHRMNPKVRAIVLLIERIILIVFTAILFYVSLRWLIGIFEYGGVSTPMKVPNYLPRLIIPISFFLLVIHNVETLIDDFKNIRSVFDRSKEVK